MVTPAGQGSPPPFFLGVAIGLELRIRLWHMLWLAFVAVGSVCLHYLLVHNFRFCPSGSSSTAPMSFLHEWLLRKSCTPGLPFFSLPSFRRAGWGWEVSGCPCVASRGFSSPPAWLGPVGGVEEPLVARSLHASSLLSPRFICGLGIQELLSCGGLLLPVLSRLVCSTLGEVLGRETLRGLFSVLGCLSRLISARSARWWGGWVFWVPLQLGSSLASRSSAWEAGRVLWACSWSNGSRVRSCCSRCRSACRAQFSGRDAVGVDRLVCCFPLCGRGAIVGGLRTASGFIAFALVVSVWRFSDR